MHAALVNLRVFHLYEPLTSTCVSCAYYTVSQRRCFHVFLRGRVILSNILQFISNICNRVNSVNMFCNIFNPFLVNTRLFMHIKFFTPYI